MLDLREAVDPEDRRAVIAVAHAANAVSEPLAWYSARRMGAALRRRATWWLLREDGEPASSLVCYPLDLRLDGAPVQGYGLGAVATRPDRRGRGHASRLCAHAGERSGGPVGVLFSAIPPALYESLGFRVVPALGVACADPASLAASGPQAPLVPIDPLASLPLLRSAFDRVSDGLRVRRDDAGWVRSLELNPADRFFAVDGGYVRAFGDPPDLEVVELVADDPAAVLRALAAIAAGAGLSRLTGWLAPPPEVAPWFAESPRTRTLPMVRGGPTTAWLSSCDYF